MNVLIVGFGAMGCRHAQSLINSSEKINIFVVDPNDENFHFRLDKIGCKESDIKKKYSSVSQVEVAIDIAIVATSSAPRFEIVKALLVKGIKKFFLEKIIFQSLKQFDETIELLQLNSATAYCNFVNRYFENYIELNKYISREKLAKINMNVIGGEFGLASNVLHYIDLFEYLSGTNLKIKKSSLVVSGKENMRGAQYKELYGSISGKSDRGDVFSISSDVSYTSMPMVIIKVDDVSFQFDQNTEKEEQIINGKRYEKEFKIVPTSVLTYPIIKDIFAGKTHLTTVEGTRNAHQEIFKHFNPVFGLPNNSDTICPIT